MKSHRNRAVLAAVIGVAVLGLQMRAVPTNPPLPADGKAPPALALTPATLSFTAEAGGAVPAAQSVAVSSSGAALGYSVSSSSTGGWLSATPASGKTPGSIRISADSAKLPAGTYSGIVIVASPDAANSPVTVAVTLTVTPPALAIAPTTLSFTAQAGGVAPPAQSVTTSSSGVAIGYSLSASSSVGWLSVKPATGTTPGSIGISVNPAGLSPGTYSGTVIVDSSDASNGPLPVAVTFTVTPVPTLAVGPELLTFKAKAGGAPPASQTITTNSSGAALGYSVSASSDSAWLSVTSSTRTTPSPISVTANPAGLAAGTYTGTVTITSRDASNGPQVVAVAFTVTKANLPTLALVPASLTFVGRLGGVSPASQTVAIRSSGAAIHYNVSAISSGDWLSARPLTGTTPDSISITANPSGLAAGTYKGSVILTSSDAANDSEDVEVSFTVTAATLPELTLMPANLSFTTQIGGVAPGAQILMIGSGASSIAFPTSTASASWLHAAAASGTTPGSISISVAPAGLAAATYTGAVTVAADGAANSPQAVFVTLTVSATPLPRLAVNPTSMSFTAQVGGKPPAGQTIAIVSTGAPLGFSVTAGSSAAWLAATPADGLTPGSITISVNPSGLAAGSYKSSISIAATGADNSPQTVPVTLVVTSAGNQKPPAALTMPPRALLSRKD